MLRHSLATCALLFAGLLLAEPAHADIYTWLDANGVVNVSNLRPPAGVNVTHVSVEKPPAPAPQFDAAREAQLQMLSERVRELEREAQAPQPAPPAPMTIVAPIYVPMMTPVVVPFQPDVTSPMTAQACDPAWLGCITSTNGLYAPGVVILPATHRRSSRLPKPLNGPVLWPTGNLAALGPWAVDPSAHRHPGHRAGPRP